MKFDVNSVTNLGVTHKFLYPLVPLHRISYMSLLFLVYRTVSLVTTDFVTVRHKLCVPLQERSHYARN